MTEKEAILLGETLHSPGKVGEALQILYKRNKRLEALLQDMYLYLETFKKAEEDGLILSFPSVSSNIDYYLDEISDSLKGEWL